MNVGGQNDVNRTPHDARMVTSRRIVSKINELSKYDLYYRDLVVWEDDEEYNSTNEDNVEEEDDDDDDDDDNGSIEVKKHASFLKSTPSKSTSSSDTISKRRDSTSSDIIKGKRRKSKPIRYIDSTTVAEKINPPSEPNIVVPNPSSNSSSSPKRNSATKSSKSSAMIRAEEIQSNLGIKHPCCIKLILKAHVDVGSGYWMGFTHSFSKFLPEVDTDMMIEDENGETHHVKYNANKYGLSAGWKKFANDHNLLQGDVLIFQLVKPFKFKVYMVRGNDVKEADDGALSLLTLQQAQTKQIFLETGTLSTKTKGSKRKNSFPLETPKKKLKSPTPTLNSANDTQEVVFEVLEGSRPSNPNLPSDFQDFHIMVQGQCIDSELPEDVRTKYHNLCVSRNELLHDSLPEDVYYKLVAGMIGETVNIANKIKTCTLTITKEELGAWDNSLKSCEVLGMKVGFLRDRIHAVLVCVLESVGRVDEERYNEAKNEKKEVENEIENVMKKLEGLKERCEKLDFIVGGLKEKVENHEVKFQEVVDAPW